MQSLISLLKYLGVVVVLLGVSNAVDLAVKRRKPYSEIPTRSELKTHGVIRW
jgi:hypothetical protein